MAQVFQCGINQATLANFKRLNKWLYFENKARNYRIQEYFKNELSSEE